MGAAEVEDQLAGLTWLKQQDFVDLNRIASMGWSYGGYMTLKLLEKAPRALAAGAAVAPVTKWELYDTGYTERYLGNPKLDPKPYESSDVLPYTSRISDPLLLIHGMSDDNVIFENTTALMAKLQQEKTPFEMMVYPVAAHAIPGEDREPMSGGRSPSSSTGPSRTAATDASGWTSSPYAHIGAHRLEA